MFRAKNTDLHGAAPHRSRVVLLLIDVINAMDFPEGRMLVRHAMPAAKRLAILKQRAKTARVPVVYANDNFGQWRSDFRATIQNALAPDKLGRDIARLLLPDDDDYFVLKPKLSAFYGSALELLLSYLGCERMVLAGFAGDMCVRFTAQDAFLRDIEIVVARDCVASETVRANRVALEFMRDQLGASLVDASRVDFTALRTKRPSKKK